jgi:hypothetical protein
VPVAALVAAMRRRGMEPRDVAVQLEWWTGNKKVADGSRVRRYLGLRPGSDGHYREYVQHRTAVMLARAIDPDLIWELGL